MNRATRLARPDEVRLSTLAQAIRGALGVDLSPSGLQIRRLPAWTASQFGDDLFLDVVSQHGSGVRLELETAASWIELTGRWDILRRADGVELPHPTLIAETGDGRTRAYRLGDGFGVDLLDSTGSVVQRPGIETRMRLDLPGPPITRPVTLWLPQGARVIITGARADADLTPHTTAKPRWIHYGSSISQCIDAEDPLGVWPVAVARRFGLDLVNLGLAGQAHLDQFVARAIRDAAPDTVTLKVGINIVAGATMTARTLCSAMHGFLDTIREGLPTTPVTVISAIYCTEHEGAPDPMRSVDGGSSQTTVATNHDPLTLEATRAILSQVIGERTAHDEHLFYLDGTQLLGAADSALLYDRVHPSPEGHRTMAENFIAASAHLPGFAGPPPSG